MSEAFSVERLLSFARGRLKANYILWAMTATFGDWLGSDLRRNNAETSAKHAINAASLPHTGALLNSGTMELKLDARAMRAH